MDFEAIEEGDHVLSIEDGCRIHQNPEKVFITTELSNTLTTLLGNHAFVYEHRAKWLEEGVNCRFLKLGGSQWIKGRLRVKISLEFCPDEPEEMELSEFQNEQ